MRKDIRENVITADASVLTWWKTLPGSVQRNCSAANTSMSSPHSGAQANMAVFFAILQPGDTYMGMNLDHGGHLTHGSPVNMSGKYYNVVPYGVNDEGVIDYDEVLRIAKECRPKMIVAGRQRICPHYRFQTFSRDRG